MVEINSNSILKVIIFSILLIIVNILLFSQEKIKNVHVSLVFILMLVLILKNSFIEN